MSQIKIGNQDIYGIYLGDNLIDGVYLGNTSIWQVIRGELQAEDDTTTSYEYVDGVVTFSGTGTIPVINNISASELYAKASDVTEIIVEDSVTEITEGAFGAFNQLQKITLPFVGKNVKSEQTVYPFGWIFGEYNDQESGYEVIVTFDYNFNWGTRTPKSYKLPSTLKEVILTGGQYNKTYICPNCFYSCEQLTNIYISQIITTIETGSFYKCQALNTLTLPFIGRTQLKDASGSAWGLAHIFAGDNFNNYENVYQKTTVYMAKCSNYNRYSGTPQTMSTAYVTILKGDIPPWAFNGFEGSNNNIIKIKILSIDNSCKYFCTQNSYGTGGAYYYINKLFLPKSILAIGDVYSNDFGEIIYYEGNNNQWETLKIKYAKEVNSTYPLFSDKTINTNAKPEDLDQEATS